MLMTSSLVIMTAGNAPYKELVQECRSPVLKIYPFQNHEAEFAGQIKEKMEKLSVVEQAEVIPYYYIIDRIRINGKKSIEGFFDLMPFHDRSHGNIRMLEGSLELKEGSA